MVFLRAIMKKILFLTALVLSYHPSLFASQTPSRTTTKQQIFTLNAPKPIGAYSQAIKENGFVFLSGQIPIDPKTGELSGGDFTRQVNQAIANLSAVAKAAGGSLDDIVKLTIYLPDLNNFQKVNDAVTKFFNQPYPARSVIGVSALPKNANVEIEAIMKSR